MARPYRLGIAGLVHDHVWRELGHWARTERVEFTAAADPNPPLRERVEREFGANRLFDDPAAMFEQCDLDVVQVCTSNRDAEPVVKAAAERGVHIVLEKPLSATLAQGERMCEAAEQGGVRFFINWPNRWRLPTLEAWNLVKQGAIGDVFHATMRMAHKGPREFGCSDYFCDWLYDASQNGAGALIDYCCYGAVAFRHLFGMPEAVQAVRGRLTKDDIDVDDNATITLMYPHRFASAEASWSQIPSYHDAVYLGTTGSLWTAGGQLQLAGEGGYTKQVRVQPLPAGRSNGPEMFLTCLETGEPFPDVCSARVCRDAQEILEAGLRAADSGRRVSLPLEGKPPGEEGRSVS